MRLYQILIIVLTCESRLKYFFTDTAQTIKTFFIDAMCEINYGLSRHFLMDS
jgi:hypothetical protein